MEMVLGQETDNPSGALHLATKFDFKIFGVFPEWQPRLTGTEEYVNKWLVAERFLERILDKQILEKTKNSPVFSPILPQLKCPLKEIELTQQGNAIRCRYAGHEVGQCKMDSGVRRFSHIQFWSINLTDGCDMNVAEQFVRHLVLDSKKQFKKVEIFSSDEKVIALLEKVGFHYRGTKTVGQFVNNKYYNQTGADFGFYTIDDAHKVLKYSKLPIPTGLDDTLIECKASINKALNSEKIDSFAECYLENMVFQMVREVHSEPLYCEANAPWAHLIDALPDNCAEIKACFNQLANDLGMKPSASEHLFSLKIG